MVVILADPIKEAQIRPPRLDVTARPIVNLSVVFAIVFVNRCNLIMAPVCAVAFRSFLVACVILVLLLGRRIYERRSACHFSTTGASTPSSDTIHG